MDLFLQSEAYLVFQRNRNPLHEPSCLVSGVRKLEVEKDLLHVFNNKEQYLRFKLFASKPGGVSFPDMGVRVGVGVNVPS